MTGASLIALHEVIDSLSEAHKQSNLILINERSNNVIYQLKKSAGSCKKHMDIRWLSFTVLWRACRLEMKLLKAHQI